MRVGGCIDRVRIGGSDVSVGSRGRRLPSPWPSSGCETRSTTLQAGIRHAEKAESVRTRTKRRCLLRRGHAVATGVNRERGVRVVTQVSAGENAGTGQGPSPGSRRPSLSSFYGTGAFISRLVSMDLETLAHAAVAIGRGQAARVQSLTPAIRR